MGQGGITGPKLAPDPMPVEAFNAYVRTTNRAMPPYREAVLSNEDLADIYAYLQSIPKAGRLQDHSAAQSVAGGVSRSGAARALARMHR